jgi:hypothetical protein
MRARTGSVFPATNNGARPTMALTQDTSHPLNRLLINELTGLTANFSCQYGKADCQNGKGKKSYGTAACSNSKFKIQPE